MRKYVDLMLRYKYEKKAEERTEDRCMVGQMKCRRTGCESTTSTDQENNDDQKKLRNESKKKEEP